MLGKTAGGLFWMFRQLERSENTARLLEAGFRIAMTRSHAAKDEWASVLTTAGVKSQFDAGGRNYDSPSVIDFLLRDSSNSSSVASSMDQARTNARLVRTALTREVWEATNEAWMTIKDTLKKPIAERDLPAVLGTIRQQSALVRGAMYGTMLRNDIYDFARIGTYLERADNTARILDVKYYVLLPSMSSIGSSLDNVQWESILRSVSAQRAYRWIHGGDVNPKDIADFILLDSRMPRSLAFSTSQIVDNLIYLKEEYDFTPPSLALAEAQQKRLSSKGIDKIFEYGLHEFIREFIMKNNEIGIQIEKDYRFTE